MNAWIIIGRVVSAFDIHAGSFLLKAKFISEGAFITHYMYRVFAKSAMFDAIFFYYARFLCLDFFNTYPEILHCYISYAKETNYWLKNNMNIAACYTNKNMVFNTFQRNIYYFRKAIKLSVDILLFFIFKHFETILCIAIKNIME